MPRTAPTIDNVGGSPSYVHVAFRMIDASGDLRTVSHDIAEADATDAKIEALAAGLAAVTNADLYSVEITQVWGAVPDSSNATDGAGRSVSVHDNVVAQLKNVTNQSVRGFIPAPAESIMTTGTDQIDGNAAALATYLTALTDIYAADSYTVVGARYTERREINEQVRF